MSRASLRPILLAALVAVASAAACNKDSITAPIEEVLDPNAPAAGTFALTRVDSKALPFAVLADSFYSIEVTAGSALLEASGQFIMPLTTRETVAGSASTYVDTTRGTWTQSGGAIMLTVQPGSVASSAMWDGRNLTVMFAIGPSTNTYVYRRQD
jgi:hypothetical protein